MRVVALWFGCVFAVAVAAPPEPLALSPCHLRGLAEEVSCGQLTVFENRERRSGRTVDIQFAVLPALRRSPAPDPLVILAGGPGQGARAYAPLLARAFRDVRRTRDIVLVDLRGTGGSHPLDCPTPADELETLTTWIFAGAGAHAEDQHVADCLAALDADPRFYTHANSLADLDDVLRALGSRQVNLWGGSWGTRAALLYAMRYPERVRSVILDGAVPLTMEFPHSAAADAERALERVFADCEREEACRRAFPDARKDLEGIVSRLSDEPAHITTRHPRTGAIVPLTITNAALLEVVRAALYSPVTASRLPALLHQAAGGEMAPLLAQWLEIASGTTETMALGATLSVLCSEDVTDPVAHAEDRSRVPNGSIFGTGYFDFWISRCRRWPKGPGLERDDGRVLTAAALILSGALDPVTPPRWGEVMARRFARSAHVVVPGAAHNTSFSGCVPELIAAFVEAADPSSLDTSCVARTPRPPFVSSTAGSAP